MIPGDLQARELRNLQEGDILLLKTGLYGLKQLLKSWRKTIDTLLRCIGLEGSRLEPHLFYLVDEGELLLLLLLLYVDDILLTTIIHVIVDLLVRNIR